MFVKKWPSEYQMVTKTYLPYNLCDSSGSSDSSYSSDSCDRSDSSDISGTRDSSDSSDRSDQTTFPSDFFFSHQITFFLITKKNHNNINL